MNLESKVQYSEGTVSPTNLDFGPQVAERVSDKIVLAAFLRS